MDAISEQDFVCDYVDFPAKPTVTAGEDHFPIGVKVHQETYNWSFSRFRNFLAVHLVPAAAARNVEARAGLLAVSDLDLAAAVHAPPPLASPHTHGVLLLSRFRYGREPVGDRA